MADATEAGTSPAVHATDASIIARLGAQRGKLRAAVKNLTGERDTFKADADRLKAENDELRKKADTSAAARRVAELEQQIRERDHRAAFDKVAKAKGVREEALADAWQLAGYKAEGEPDDEAIGVLIEEQRAARGYLFGGADADKPDDGKPPVKPGVGSGKGGKPAGAPQILGAGDPRMSDVKYQFLNFDRISEAARERMQRGEI